MGLTMGIGTYRHVATVENPGPHEPDGLGGYTPTWIAATPATLKVSITPATAKDLETVTAGTVTATATHLVRGRWHPGITPASRLRARGRTLNVLAVGNPDERDRTVVLICAEVFESL
jgi:head-tail adaptor